MSGHLHSYSHSLQNAFINASQTSVPACTALMKKFVDDVKAGRHAEEGWPTAAYSVFKAGIIAMTKAVAL